MTLSVRFEDFSPSATRTCVYDDIGRKIGWCDADEDRVLYVFDDFDSKNVFTSMETGASPTRTFTGELDDGATATYVLWSGKVLSKDRSYIRGSVISGTSLVLPDSQNISDPHSFDRTANIAVMKSGDAGLRNVFGYIRYRIPEGEGGNARIKSVTFSADEDLAGPVQIDYSGSEPVATIMGSGSKSVTVNTHFREGDGLGYEPGYVYAVLPPGTYHNFCIMVTPFEGDAAAEDAGTGLAFMLLAKEDVVIRRGQFTDAGTIPFEQAVPEFPRDGRWPNDPEAFDYEVAESKTAKYDGLKDATFPLTFDKVTYGSRIGFSTDKVVLFYCPDNGLDSQYGAPIPTQRFISIKVNKPGMLDFIPRQNNGVAPTVHVTLLTNKGGTRSAKQLFEKSVTNTTKTESDRVYIPVLEDDLDGITEAAVIYIYSTEPEHTGQLIMYPVRWWVMPTETTYDVDGAAAAMKEKVLRSPNTVNPATWPGNCYYVSNDGSDSNNGRSPSTAIKTLEKLANMGLQPGDAVLFRRGDVWRRSASKLNWEAMLYTKPGVTYSSYGSGEKPMFLGSPWNAAKEGTWTLSETRNVYVYSATFGAGTVGTILLDGTECARFKFGSITHTQLREDLTCCQDDGKLYLCSTAGNPSTRFQSMEIFVGGHGIKPVDNVTIDNLCIRYVGSHGIGSGYTAGLTVTNCEVGWIGGSVNHAGESSAVRYGNGIQIFGGCDRFTVSNCWVYQCYDAGITHQYSSTGDCIMANVTYSANLVEDCIYGFEYFLALLDGSERMMRNVLYDRNIIRRSGYGWGSQRPSPEDNLQRHIMSWGSENPSENFVICNNVFDRCNSGGESLYIYAKKAEWQPVMFNNLSVR